MRKRYFDGHPLSAVAAALAGVFLLAPALNEAGWKAYDQLHPVHTEWKTSRVEVDGDDLILEGTMVKRRCDCEYVPPPRARDASGRHYPVVSTNPTAGQSWSCSPGPQRFGPWRVVGGANARPEIYQQHQCADGRTVFTTLGRVAP